MKPLFKIGLFFLCSVLVVIFSYLIIKGSMDNNENNYAKTPEIIINEEINVMESEATPIIESTKDNNEEPVYFMTCVDGCVTVFYPDLNTIFIETGIYIDDLPYEIRESIIEGRIMYSVEEMYNFLESYTS